MWCLIVSIPDFALFLTFILLKDSPTVENGAMRMVLAITSSIKSVIKTTDIKSTFYKVRS